MDESLLRYLALGLAGLITFMSVYGVLVPDRLAATVGGVWARPWSMAFAIGIRVLLGTVLILLAPESRLPLLYLVLGWAAIIAAVALPLAGRERVGRLIGWATGLSPLALRAWCLLGVAFGLLVAYGVL